MMMFWDSSAIIPLCIEERFSGEMRQIFEADQSMVVWWGSFLECYSVFARIRRAGVLDRKGERWARKPLVILEKSWIEILPSRAIKEKAVRLISIHDLKAADSLQLTAALLWSAESPKGCAFVCLDRKLRYAAEKEGFDILPAAL